MTNTIEQQIVKISENELLNLLLDFKGTSMISMLSLTDTDMNKYKDYKKLGKQFPNPYFEQIKTLSYRYKINIGFDSYEDLVNKRRENEGLETDFVQKENWFERYQDSRVVVTDKRTKSKFYLRYQFMKDSILDMKYIFEGNEIDRQLFEDYMKEKSNYENQGVENTLNFQVVGLHNILEMTLNKVKYIIEH